MYDQNYYIFFYGEKPIDISSVETVIQELDTTTSPSLFPKLLLCRVDFRGCSKQAFNSINSLFQLRGDRVKYESLEIQGFQNNRGPRSYFYRK